MKLFSEIHSRYFFIINEILKTATVRKISCNEIAATVTQLGFTETPIFLTPALKNDNGEGYYLLQKEPDGYTATLKNPLSFTITELQKRWIKTLVNDRRFSLFIDEAEQNEYTKLLVDIEPLYESNHIITVDIANDGDDYENGEYRMIFKTIMQAIQDKKMIRITYESGKNNRISSHFAPYKLEYSIKDDKFRLCTVRMHNKRMKSLYKLNLSRIKEAVIMDWNAPLELGEFVKSKRMPLPIELEISNERNGFERIFTQLSNFERISEYNEITKKCFMKIFYYEVDEMELLITLLSFGPIIRIIGPERFKNQITERIIKQKQLFKK